MKNKLTLLTMVASIIILTGCQKDEILSETVQVSAHHDEYKKFKKEIVVYDKNKENSLFFMVHANYPGDIEHYLENHELTLVYDKEEIIGEIGSTEPLHSPKNASTSTMPLKARDHQVSIELITENISSDISTYFLDVRRSSLKSVSSFQFGEFDIYKTSGDFIGIVHKGYWNDNSGDEYDIYVYLESTDSWSSSWEIRSQGLLLGNSGGYPYSNYLNYTVTGSPYYKIGAGVYLDARTNGANYYVAYNKDDFRGRFCTIGTYDKANCYVGTAPSGTTAFMYPNAQGAFYYTPINGNQCPLSGSWFDGAHCYVIDIPSSCEGYIYNNKWQVKSDKLL